MNQPLLFSFLILAATIFPARYSHAEQIEQTIQDPQESADDGSGRGAFRSYYLPRSNGHSIYFLPGSADLDDSAGSAIAEAVSHLASNPALRIMLTPFVDISSDGENADDLSKNRAAAVADALIAGGVNPDRISVTARRIENINIARCSSEYCRQSYRRVEMDFSRSSVK